MQSLFTQKNSKPSIEDTKLALDKTYEIWETLVNYTKGVYPNAKDEWKFTNEKFGWSYRISDKKRVIIYFLPRNKFFKVAFVFGHQAFEKIETSNINETIVEAIKAAKVHAEGRGIRIDVNDQSLLNDIKKLIDIKIEGSI